MKKTLLTITMGGCLAACQTAPSVEQTILKEAAIADARAADKDIHLAFLQCYGLWNNEKDKCQRIVGKQHARYDAASSWDYIRPFRHEAERLGFKHFLNEKGKRCERVDEGPQYNDDQGAYIVNCTSGEQYTMQFNREALTWSLGEGHGQ